MLKKQLRRIKSMLLSGAIAVTALAAPLSATVPSLTATAADNDNYARLLQYSLYFYDANMCGQIEGKTGLSWRGNCHTSDGVVGGYHDAGDHAMFGLPQGFTASMLEWSYYEFKDSFEATGQSDHMKVILDHFTDFFKKSADLNGNNVSRILYQKGDGNIDHGYWGPPEQQGSREMRWTSNGAGDVAADYAAALAIHYLNFGDQEALKYAEALYSYATRNPGTADHQTFYKNGSSQDEIANAAGWLYLATKNESYKNDCASRQAQYLGWVDGWENRDLGSACVYAYITGDWSKVNGWIGSKANGNNYFFLDQWGSARLNCSMQFTALVASKHSNADYTGWVKNQMNYILGDNPARTCFVTGYASNSAKNAHHRAASGYTSYNEFPTGELDMSNHMNVYSTYGSNSHTLIGALVGGPCDAGGTYHDNMSDYVCNEVAIDYNAGLVGAAAGLYSVYKSGSTDNSIEGVKKIYSASNNTTTTSTTTTTTTTRNNNDNTTTSTTTTKNNNTSGGNGTYTIKPGTKFDYAATSDDDRMVAWKWSEFDIPANETITKVEVKISANSKIGKWQGAFGTSTSQSPDYWAMSDEMSETFSGTSGTITWDIPTSISSIIQTKYNGELKFGTWWVDEKKAFTIDSVTVYTKGGSSSNTTTSTTTTSRTTTSTTTTKNNTSGGDGTYTIKPGTKFDYAATDEDDRMVAWKWSEFDIPANATITKVEVKISANSKLGKWQGAFGTSTSESPDYWAMSDEMSETFSGTTGTITWNIPTSISSIIQTKYNGELKFGTWWIDEKKAFTIDSVTVYTKGGSSSTTTSTTTSRTTTSTTSTSTTTTGVKPTTPGDANCDGEVNLADAVFIMQSIASPSRYKLTKQGEANADVNGGGISTLDALLIQRYMLGLESKLPV